MHELFHSVIYRHKDDIYQINSHIIYLLMWLRLYYIWLSRQEVQCFSLVENKGNNKITELRTILQKESQNS
jgi:hypothetical protein